ncbi:Choline/carnitine O-acyltransferase [Sulfidibacter corallicola]|uniref:Choline/carnitine O-acyltransferase n=1 Tax=Sulfidibacter corallicola TaxID=2818388 RepID=A0A8A4TU35_SULCO|nr:choline/carnitine O-acyltransferase [Sulfidibacter corallicola]QTD50045.1 choline/carnitine O-acyltransferase [Sulfidibacter corallicola]
MKPAADRVDRSLTGAWTPTGVSTRLFFLFAGGQAASTFGSNLTGFALSIWIYQETGSATLFAMAISAAFLPSLLLTPLLGGVIDRVPKKRVILVCDSGCALVAGLIVFCFMTDRLSPALLFALILVQSVFSGIQGPAVQASVVSLVNDDHLVRINSLLQTGHSVAGIGAGVAAGVLFETIGIAGILGVDLVTFLWATATLLPLRIPETGNEEAKGTASPTVPNHHWRDMLSAWHWMRRQRGVMPLLVLNCMVSATLGFLFVIMPTLILDATSPQVLSLAFAAGSAGVLCGSLLCMSTWIQRHTVLLVQLASLVMGLALCFAWVPPQPALTAGSAFLFSIDMAVFGVLSLTLFQRAAPPDMLGRVLLLKQTSGNGCQALGFLLGGPLAAGIGALIAVPNPAPVSAFAGDLLAGFSNKGGPALLLLYGSGLAVLAAFYLLAGRLSGLQSPSSEEEAPNIPQGPAVSGPPIPPCTTNDPEGSDRTNRVPVPTPSFPCPDIDHILDRFATELLPAQECESRRRIMRRLMGGWCRLAGARKRHQAFQIRLDQGHSVYSDDVQERRWRSLFLPENSFTIGLAFDPNTDLVERAAVLTANALWMRRLMRTDRYPVETDRGIALDMSGYDRLFDHTLGTIPLGKNRFKLAFRRHTGPGSVVFLIRGHIYRVALDRDLSVSDWKRFLTHAIDHARAQGDSLPVIGSVTTLLTAESARHLADLRSRDGRSVETLLDEASLVVALDLDGRPQSEEAVARSIHIDRYSNRDYRQPLQLCLSSTGQAGLVFSHLMGLDGVVAARCAHLMATHTPEESGSDIAPNLPAAAAAFVTIDPATVPEANWLTSHLREIESRRVSEDTPTVHRSDVFGMELCRRHGLSPNGIVSCAMALAFSRLRGHTPTMGTFTHLRHCRHGRIARLPIPAEALGAFVACPSSETLSAALTAYRHQVRSVKTENTALNQVFYILCGGRIDLGFLGFALLAKLFAPHFVKRLVAQDVWISNIPALEGLAFAGRPGTRLGFVPKGALAGHVMFFPNHMTLCFGNRGVGADDRGPLFRELDRALRDIATLLPESSVAFHREKRHTRAEDPPDPSTRGTIDRLPIPANDAESASTAPHPASPKPSHREEVSI